MKALIFTALLILITESIFASEPISMTISLSNGVTKTLRCDYETQLCNDIYEAARLERADCNVEEESESTTEESNPSEDPRCRINPDLCHGD